MDPVQRCGRLFTRRPSTMELGSRIGPMPIADQERLSFSIRYLNAPEALQAPPF